MFTLIVLASTVLLLGNARAECPHQRAGLLRWSESATWGTNGKPAAGDNVIISQNILLDESPPSLKNITINTNCSLVFDPEVKMELRAMNIFVSGSMEIGSEDCRYNQSLTITLTGNRQEHNFAKNPKVILVQNGGTLEVHGELRMSWTVLNKTLLSTSKDIFFEHKTNPAYNTNTEPRVVAYTVKVTGTTVNVKKFGVYDLRYESKNLTKHINEVTDGDVLMMASFKKVLQKLKPDTTAYDALELVTGSVSNSSVFRTVGKTGETWAFVYKKGTPDSYGEKKNPLGTTSTVQYRESDDLIYTVESIGDENVNKQTVNFRISNSNAFNPLVEVIDDVTTWREGDEVVIASTDFSPSQAEKHKIVFCPTCNNFQFRVDRPIEYTHYGKVLHGAVDMRAEVMLLSRKVVIKGEMEATCPSFNKNCGKPEVGGKDTFGAHIKALHGYKAVHIENIEIYNAGQQTDLGRYPFHFHMCLDANQNDPYIKGCSIHDTFARCITVHGSDGVLLQDNACFNFMGHGYFFEDGGEFNNILDGNLAINAIKGTGALDPTDSSRPSGFWITNPNNTVINNHAAGGVGSGIWLICPQEPLPPSRQYNLIAEFEARRTPLTEFNNNVAHSNTFIGIHIGARIEEDRKTHCCNIWQPLADPKNTSSAPINVYFQNITGFKNEKFNIWIEGSLLQISRISVSDSANGIMVSNEKLLDHAGTLSYSVIIGDSENVGEPTPGYTRSLARVDEPHSGVTIWRGVNNYHHLWFDGFRPHDLYDNAAIMKKRGDRYFFSVTNAFRDILFAHDDAPGVGNYFMSGNYSDKGWEKQRDGELGMGVTWYKNSTDKWYIVKPDPLSAAASDSKLRPNWRLAFSKIKYGNLRMNFNGIDAFYSKKSYGIFVRDKFPGAQVKMDLEKSAGPTVVLNGTETYTFHTTGKIADWLQFTADGIENNEVLRIGICVPPGSTWKLTSKFPVKLKAMDDFDEVNSLADLDKFEPTKDGKKYFFDNSTSMVYYKFRGVQDRKPDDRHECGGGICPGVRIDFSGNLTGSADCRQRLYGSDLSKFPPVLPAYTDTITANGASIPPAGYGHGSSRPFASRKPVNGRYSEWTSWTDCTQTCGGGTQFRTRECNSPIPQHGGRQCANPWFKTRDCNKASCP